MAEYNLPNEKGRNRFEAYLGRKTEQMPKLIADGRVPISVAGLMQRRLDVRNYDDKIKSQWINNSFDTGDAVVYHPDNRIKIVLDSQHLRDMTPDTLKHYGALILIEEDIYNSLEGEEFKRDKIGKMGEWLSKKDVKSHPIWKSLARDQSLLNDYADYIFEEGKERFDYDFFMGVFPDPRFDEYIKMRVWCVTGLENMVSALGGRNLDNIDGCLLGIAPEAYTMADLQEVDKTIKRLEGTLHPDVLKPFVDLRKKL